MDSSDVIQLLSLMILLALSAFFSSSETALTTVNKIRVRTLAESGVERAVILSKVIEQQGKMLSAILIGNNIVNLSASSLMTTLTIKVFGNKAVGLATGVLTLLILVFGEITPKTLSTISAETMALRSAKIIYMLMWLLTPVIVVVNKLSLWVLMLMKVDPNKKQEMITEDELRTIVEVSHEEGVIETEEKKMINNVFDFGDSLAKDIMVPRIDMTFINVDATYEIFEAIKGQTDQVNHVQKDIVDAISVSQRKMDGISDFVVMSKAHYDKVLSCIEDIEESDGKKAAILEEIRNLLCQIEPLAQAIASSSREG